MALPWLPIAGAVLGGIAGAQGTPGQSATSRRSLAPESEQEQIARQAVTGGFGQLEDIWRGQLGSQATAASESLAQLLQQYQATGGVPGQVDITAGQQYAQQITAPQQAQIELAMRQSRQEAARQAGISGRAPTDFALQTRLAGQQADLMSQLGAQQSSIGAQYAQQIAQQRLGYAGQLAELRQGLASQAMQNRMAIMGLGTQVQQAGQQFRLNAAPVTEMQAGRPGGLMGALTGAFQGATGFMKLNNMFGGGASAGAQDFGQGLQMPTIGAGLSNPTAGGVNLLGAQTGQFGTASQNTQFTMPTLGSSIRRP